METIDAYNDPYAQRYYARVKRKEFEKFKKTEEYLSWRRIQLRAQQSRCAYCKIKLTKENIIVHVDHVTPLFHEGKNNIENLVLTCRRCNIRKWTANNYVYPAWIKENKRKHRVRRLKLNQKKLMKDIVRMELDELMLENELSWLKAC